MKTYLPFALFFLNSSVFAQTQKELDLNDFLEKTVSTRSEGANYDALFENFYQLHRNPLDLNSADADDLSALYLLSPQQVQGILHYRQEQGLFLSIYELQAVPSLDMETIRKILPFVVVNAALASWKDLIQKKANNHYLLLRTDRTIETQKGFSPATIYQGKPTQRYLGDAQRLFIRYRLSDGKNYSLGLTAEKDAGEQFTWNPAKKQFGIDYWSFHAQIKNRGKLKNLVLGDYQIQVGQGLVLSSGFYLGKSSETVYSVRRSNLGIRPYTSTTEGDFFRGAAATYQLGKFDLTGFYSSLNRDANINESGVVTSLLNGGLHRTTAELADKAVLNEQNMGLYLSRKWRSGNVGISFLQTRFGVPILKRDLPYNAYEFQGNANEVLGLQFNQYVSNWNFFGEAARSRSGGLGVLAGLMGVLNKRLEVSSVFRHYDKNFHSFYANAFGEGSRNINETGGYLGVKYSLSKRLWFNAYFDVFRFPWLRYLVDEPNTTGKGLLVRSTYRPNKQFETFVQYTVEQNFKNLTLDKQKWVNKNYRNAIVAHAEYKQSSKVSFRTRVYWNNYGFKGQTFKSGMAILQDADLKRSKISLTGRLAYFNTDDYDTRVYAYERDVMYSISFPFYMNTGWRKYLIVQYPYSKSIDIWLRISRTTLSEEDHIGSDLSQINKPHKTDARLQIRYKF